MRLFRLILLGGAAAAVLLAPATLASAQIAGSMAAGPVAQDRLAPLPDVDIPYTRFVLNNGLTLIVHEDHKVPIVAVNIWYHVGSKNEPAGRSGFAHLFEHLMFNGSENFNDDFFKASERFGATDQNGTTSQDRTNYFQNVPTSMVDGILWLESDRMGHLLGAVDQARLDEQRGVVQNEKRQGESQPYGLVGNAITSATYPLDHPYGHTVIGSMDDLDAASLEDVQGWFRTWYGPTNATIVLAGDITPEEARQKVEHFFGDIPPGPPVVQPQRRIARMAGASRDVMQDRVGEPRLYKVWNVPPGGEADTDYLGLLADILAVGRSSRLHKRLVFDDQVATDVSAGISEGEVGSQFQITVTAAPDQDLARIEAIVDEEMARLLRDGPTVAEMERARTSNGAAYVRGLERIGGFGGKSDRLAASQVFHGDPSAWRTSYQRILAATPGELTTAGREWLQDGSYTLEVRPFPDYVAAATGADRSRAPTPLPPPLATFPEIEHATLSTGLQVMFVPRIAVPTISMNLIFDAGSAVEPADQRGVSVLTSTVLTNGTGTLDALEISDRQQMLGATLGARSSINSTTVSMTAIASRLVPSLALFADIVRNPAFRAEDIARGRTQQIAGIQQASRIPAAIANRVLASRLYGPENPYGRPVAGNEASVGGLTAPHLQAYHQAWYRPDNATLVVVGDTTLAELEPALERAFAGWRAPSSALSTRPPIPTLSQAPGQPQILIVDRPGPQSMIYAGRRVPAFDARTEAAIETMTSALSGSFTSRVNMNLREDKQWSYGAGGDVRSARGERSYVVSAGVQTDKTAESLAELRREFAEVVDPRPLSEVELAGARANLVQGLAGEWETNAAVMDAMSRMVTFGVPAWFYRSYASDVSATTQDAVSEVVGSVIGDGLTAWVVVGDRAQIEPKIRALGFGDVQVVDVDGRPVQ